MFSFKALRKSSFVKNISLILSGSVIAQLVTILSTPILTRLYGTESYGVFGIFMTLTSIFATFSSGRYNLAVMLPKKDEDSLNIIVLCSLFSLIVGILLAIFVILFFHSITGYYYNQALSIHILWLPIIVVVNDWFQVISNWVGRKKRYLLISIAMIAGAIFGNAWRIGAGYYNPSAQGLIFGSILIFFVQFIILLIGELSKLKALFIYSYDFSTIKRLAVKYRQLPIYRAPKDLLNSLSQNAPTIMLSLYFSDNKVGLFYLVDRILKAPSVLLGNAVRRVYYQKATEIHNSGKSLYPSAFRLTAGLALIGFIPFFITIIYGPYLFGYIFGHSWAGAGVYARWISIFMFFAFINVPSIVVIPILGLEKIFFYFEIVSILLRIISLFYGGIILESDVSAIMLYGIVGALIEIFVIVYIIAKLKYTEAI